ncbi:hypothetical protein Tco_1430789 [Tanacetum coccineum]
MINKKKVSLDVDMYREILQIFPKIPGQEFEDLPLEQNILSFIRDLGHTGDITYLTDVNVDYLHQPCRAFATVINKCLSGKETGMDKIRLSHAKNTNKMSYPIFTKIIIDYFMSKVLDYSRKKPDVLASCVVRDDTMFTSMRCISRHEDTQTYYAFASGEKTPKPKYVRKKADSDTSPKQKPVQATKGTRIKSKAKVAKSDKKKQPAKKPKAKGLAVLSEVALTEAEQLKLATKRSKKDFHISHASGSGDGVDTQSKVPDEQQQKTSGTDEGTGTIPGVPDVPIYESESEKESWGDSDEEDDDEDEFDDDSDDNDEKEEEYDDEFNIEEDEKIDDEETMNDDEDDEVTKELYDDVNVNLGNKDTDITNAAQGASEQQNVSQESGFGQVEEDAHVTLTPVLDTQKVDAPVKSSSVSSDFTSKLLNLENPSPTDNEIASLLDTTARHATTVLEITSSFTTTIPPPTLFNNRVINLVKDLSKIKQVDRKESQDEKNAYIELVDTSMRALIKEEVNTQLPQILPQVVSDFANPVIEKNITESVEAAVLTRSSSQPKSTYEAAASLFEFELTKILIDKMEKNKSNDKADYKKKLYDALFESYNTKKDLFDLYGEVFSLKRSRDDRYKDQDPSAGSDRGTKRRKSNKDANSSRDSRSNEKKSSSTSKDASQSQDKSSGKSSHAEEPSHTVDDSGVQQDQEFDTGNNNEQPANKEVTKDDWFKKPERPPTPDSN